MQTLLVIPCYRESKRLPRFLPELCKRMQAIGDVRIQVVDDGSGPDEIYATRTFVAHLRNIHPALLPLLELPVNIGKGRAVYTCWADSDDTEWLGFVDADGSCSPEEVARFILWARTQARSTVPTAFFGSRIKMLGRNVDRLFKRHFLGRVFATLVSELLDVPVYDSQCGLKLVPSKAYQTVANKLQIKGFAFDVELMVALLDTGCRIEEVPIDWHEVPGGKVRLWVDPWRMFLDIIKIRSRRKIWQKGLVQ